jgi:hypothetical protein
MEAPPRTGTALTVKLRVFEQPVVSLVKVRLAVPGATPVTVPVSVTVATVSSLLDQVPPVDGVTTLEEPTQPEAAPPSVGGATTVKVRVLVQPVASLVKVRVTAPGATAVTAPASVTVAIAVLLLNHVPPVDGVTLAVSPWQLTVAPPRIGGALTVKLRVLVQPLVALKVRVTFPAETPVTSPAGVTLATAVLLLDQVPPVAGVTFAVLPWQTAVAPPRVGRAMTVKALVY